MIDFILKYANLILANWEKALIVGSCSISATIVLFGMFKALFKKISNEKIRKVVTAISSLILVFPVTAGCFAIWQINFEHYSVGVLLNIIGTIVGYWFYEYTGSRDIIHLIGEKTLGKFATAFVAALKTSNQTAQVSKIVAKNELIPQKPYNQTEEKVTVKSDYKDLSNL